MAVGIVLAVLALLLVSIFVFVARSAREDVAYEQVQRVGYRMRRYWLTTLLACGMTVVVLTFFYLPYASGSGAGRTVVKVTAGQFFWSLSPARVRADTPVRFDVTSLDVNHGFGLYDPRGHLIGSVQAMPGYHNELDLTLTIPGTYLIRCLEFCGLNHAVMQGSFNGQIVTADDAYLVRSITDPDAQIVDGYHAGLMAPAISGFDLGAKRADVRALVAFIKSQK